MKKGRVSFRPAASPRHQLCVMCVLEHNDSKAAHHWHHIISAQRLRRYVQDQHLSKTEAWALERRLINDPRNLLALCVHHHLDAKGGRTAIIPAMVLEDTAWEFARELELEYLLERQYG